MDRLLPYQFKVTHIPGRDMGIVDYLSREPNGEPWPESELDERFLVTSIESFHKALDCLSSRLSETDQNIDINILEHSGIKREINHCKDSSSHGCYGDQFFQNWTKLDRNKNGQSSRFQREQNEKKTLNKIAQRNSRSKTQTEKIASKFQNNRRNLPKRRLLKRWRKTNPESRRR